MADENPPGRQDVEDMARTLTEIHDRVIGESGGLAGTRDAGGVENTARKIAGYVSGKEDPVTVAAEVYMELARRHHFNDGNKRTAHVMAKTLLLSNGLYLKVGAEAADFITSIADPEKDVPMDEIKKWIGKDLVRTYGSSRSLADIGKTVVEDDIALLRELSKR